MPLKTPLLRVSRPVAACQRCRTAKIRCDGKLPACTACERSGRAAQCSSTSQFAPGKERSYVVTLEAQIERLEKKLHEVRRRRQSSLSMLDVFSPITSPPSRSSTWENNTSTPSAQSRATPGVTQAQVKQEETSQKPEQVKREDSGSSIEKDTIKTQKMKARKEMHTIDELVSDFGYLTVSATARDYAYGFTNSISYAKLILAASTKEPLPAGMRKTLPSRTDSLPLVNAYVENCLALQPVFLEAEIYGSLERIYDTTGNTAMPLDHWTIRMVLAIVCGMQSKQRGDTLYTDAVGHICEALILAEQVLHPGSMKSIQALLLLVNYSMIDPAHFDSWTLVGASSRAMVDLGLHQDPSKSWNTPRAKLELRRRVYHSVYGLDRTTSIVQTRAFSFSDDSANVGDPFQAKKPSTPGAGGAGPSHSPGRHMWQRTSEIALAYIEFRKLQSSWYSELFQSGREPWQDPYTRIWQIYRELNGWYLRLPANAPPPVRTFLEMDLLYSYVYILSPSPRCPQPSEHAQRLLLQHAAEYAHRVLGVLSEPGQVNSLSPFSFYDALRVFMVAKWYIETLVSNLDGLLMPPRHTSSLSMPSTIDSSTTMAENFDPLSSFATAPPLLTPEAHPASQSHNTPVDKSNQTAAQYAISTIEAFLNSLSSFEMRFGRVSGHSWRDRIQQDSTWLMGQLQQRHEAEQMNAAAAAQGLDSSGYFWRKQGVVGSSGSVGGETVTTSPATQSAAAVSIMGTSPSRGGAAAMGAAYYPSPVTSQYSPGHYAVKDISSGGSMPGSSDIMIPGGGAGSTGGSVGQVPLWSTAGAQSASSVTSQPVNIPSLNIPTQQYAPPQQLHQQHHQQQPMQVNMMNQQSQHQSQHSLSNPQQPPQQIVMPEWPNTAGFTGTEFGIGNMAAWETLPGGNMNPRFS